MTIGELIGRTGYKAAEPTKDIKKTGGRNSSSRPGSNSRATARKRQASPGAITPGKRERQGMVRVNRTGPAEATSNDKFNRVNTG